MPDGNSAESAGKSLHEPAPSAPTPEADAPIAQSPTEKQPQRRPLWMWIAGGVLLLLALYEAIPWAITAFRTESTDDAYVNGHVTFVAPRVPGQVVRVLVDDNNRVRTGDLLVQRQKKKHTAGDPHPQLPPLKLLPGWGLRDWRIGLRRRCTWRRFVRGFASGLSRVSIRHRRDPPLIHTREANARCRNIRTE